MAWHVLTGRYYMAYDCDDPKVNVQPYDLFARTEGYSVVVVFDIEHGLIGSGVGCDPNSDVGPNNPESHIDVSGVTFALAARWNPGERFFLSGGTGRLYFGPVAGTSDQQRDFIISLFTQSNNDRHLGAFQSINTWTTNHARITADMKPAPVGGVTQIDAPLSPVQSGPGGSIDVGGTLRLAPRMGQGANYALLHAEPAFRAGGQLSNTGVSVDVEGAALATVANSTWTDQELGIGNMKIDGHGESRSFLWHDEERAPIHVKAIVQASTSQLGELAGQVANIENQVANIEKIVEDILHRIS
jgi:hypothetical protein